MKIRSAYITAGGIIIAAIIGVIGSAFLNNNNQEPKININGNNSNIVQNARDVSIEQNINEISKLKEYEANALKQSLSSGCLTMLDYFENLRNFNLDHPASLIGSIWVQKERFISFFGANKQKEAMRHVDKIQTLYVEFIPGIAVMHNQNGMDFPEEVKEKIINKTKQIQPQLVTETQNLCDHIDTLKFIQSM